MIATLLTAFCLCQVYPDTHAPREAVWDAVESYTDELDTTLYELQLEIERHCYREQSYHLVRNARLINTMLADLQRALREDEK